MCSKINQQKMDETSSETLTSVSTTNDKDNKSKKEEGKKNGTKETSSGLSKNDKERDVESDIESNEGNNSPASNNSQLTTNEDKSDIKISEKTKISGESENSDRITPKEMVSNEVDDICQKHSVKNEIQDKAHKDLEGNKEKGKVQNETVNASSSDETAELVTEKSNGHDSNEDCSHDDTKSDDKKEGTNIPSVIEEKVYEMNENDEPVIENNKPSNSEEDEKYSSSTSTLSPNVQNEYFKTEDKANDKEQSNDISTKVQITTNSSTPSTKIPDKASAVDNQPSVEVKKKDDRSMVRNKTKTSEIEKPQQNANTSECHKQQQEREKQKRTNDVNNMCESSAIGTKQPAEPHSSSFPNNSSKAPSAATAKLNTLEILTAKHLNDSSKFEIFKGLIEVGKMTNKEVVNAVLYLVRCVLIFSKSSIFSFPVFYIKSKLLRVRFIACL